METFTELKALVANPGYGDQRRQILCNLTDDMIGKPIVDIINGFNKLPCCFILQSCYGHFVYNGQVDSSNLEPLPSRARIDEVEYKIAYIAFCIENSLDGKRLLDDLKEISAIDQQYYSALLCRVVLEKPCQFLCVTSGAG